MEDRVISLEHKREDGKIIRGWLHVPEEPCGKTVVYCHFFAKNSDQFLDCIPPFHKKGAMVYVFDFCGGCNETRSDGTTEEMSVLTELEDLLTVMKDLQEYELTKDTEFYGAGMSQGGYVTMLAACRYPDMFKKLFLANPAFVIADYCRNALAESGHYMHELWGHKLSDMYSTDVMGIDIYSEMADCKPRVVIMHGSRDRIVPIAYSERAVKVLPDSELVVIEGATHMMRDDYAVTCAKISAHEMMRED